MPSSRFSRSRKTIKKPAICKPPPPPFIVWPPPGIKRFWVWLVWVSPTSSGFDFTQNVVKELFWRPAQQDWFTVTATAAPYAEVSLSFSVVTQRATAIIVPHATAGVDIPASASWTSPPLNRPYDSGIIPMDPSPPRGQVTAHFIRT